MAEKIQIEGQEIAIKVINEEDYVSLTDIAKQREAQRPVDVITSWINNLATIEFMEVWEEMHNPNFKVGDFTHFRIQHSRSKVQIRIAEFIQLTKAIGVVSKPGRYGGTYAHVDVAFEFASWLSPAFKLRIIKEYQRLRSQEAQRKKINWDASRELARLNYPIQTAAIAETTGSISEKKRPGYYAKEADMLNEIVFGMTAKEWRRQNPNVQGNLRDTATTVQNILIANLENLNSYLIKNGASDEARRRVLAATCASQSEILKQKYLPE